MRAKLICLLFCAVSLINAENRFGISFSPYLTINSSGPLISVANEFHFYREKAVHIWGYEGMYWHNSKGAQDLDTSGMVGTLVNDKDAAIIEGLMVGISYSREFRNNISNFYWGPTFGFWHRIMDAAHYSNKDIFSFYFGGIRCDYEFGQDFFVKLNSRILFGLDHHTSPEKNGFGFLPSIGAGVGYKF